jgi:hypothetical protein
MSLAVYAKGRIWRGPVVSESHARAIIGWAAWPPMILSAALLFSAARALSSGDLTGAAAMGLVFALYDIPAFVLVMTRSMIAAIALFLILLLPDALTMVTAASTVASDPTRGMEAFLMELVWLAMTMQAWRAIKATRTLGRMGKGAAVAAHNH